MVLGAYPDEVFWTLTEPGLLQLRNALATHPIASVLAIGGATALLFRVVLSVLGAHHRLPPDGRGPLWLILSPAGLIVSILVSLVFGGYVATQSRETAVTRSRAYELAAQAHGVAKDNLTYTAYFRPDGSAAQEILYTLRAIGGDAERVEEVYRVIGGTASRDRVIELLSPEIGFEKSSRLIKLEDFTSTGQVLFAVYRVDPRLPAGHSERLGAPFKQLWAPGSYAMNQEELEKSGLPYEFLAIRIAYPTNKLEVKLVFPHGYWPIENSWGVRVWYGPARAEHPVEQARLEKAIETGWKILAHERDALGNLKISLTVEYPVHSLLYALTWQPRMTP